MRSLSNKHLGGAFVTIVIVAALMGSLVRYEYQYDDHGYHHIDRSLSTLTAAIVNLIGVNHVE